MNKGLNWRQCKNYFYKIYPSSYSEEFLNLCWYCWGGCFFPIQAISVVELVWNIDIRLRDMGYTVHQDVIWSVTTQIPGCQQNQPSQSSLFSSTEEEIIQLFSWLQWHFFIQISSVSHCLLSSGFSTKIFICREIALF